MKTFTKILTAAAATALLATGCVNEDPAYKNNEPGTPPDPNAKGYLTLADMSMRVVVDTDTETNNMAVEVNVGVMGISYTHTKQVHNQVTVGKRNTSMMNFKVNIFSIGLGMAFYL